MAEVKQSKLTFTVAEILEQAFIGKDVYGFTVVKTIDEVKERLDNVHIQEAIDFTTMDMEHDAAIETVKISMRIQLANFVVSGLIKREGVWESPDSGPFVVGALHELGGLGDDVKVYETSDVRMRHLKYYHHGGFIWCEGTRLFMGFKIPNAA